MLFYIPQRPPHNNKVCSASARAVLVCTIPTQNIKTNEKQETNIPSTPQNKFDIIGV